MRAWQKEPLVHFLIGGALLFAFFAWRGEPIDPASREISVDSQTLAGLSASFELQARRAPTDAELDNLIERYVREEVLYREALRLGLDRDDAVVRRRLAQKMDLIAAAQADSQSPSDEQLQTWLETHKARFSKGSRYSLDQLWFAERDAAEKALNGRTIDSIARTQGSTIDLPAKVENMSGAEVANRFGQQFLRELEALEPSSSWQGPIPSGLGWHLVRLREVDVAELPPLAEVRGEVERDWRFATATQRRAEAYQELRDAYTVEIER